MRKFLSGKVVSNAALDTAIVEVASWKTHRIFRKRYKTTKRYMVQNTGNTAELGQTVTIAPCRPISKRKSWTIITETTSAKNEMPAKKVAKTKKGQA